MNKSDFHDKALPDPISDGIILRRDDIGVWTNVPHVVVHHSPTGFEWGYGGSGPADLALNVVEVVLNRIGYKGDKMKCWDGDCFMLSWSLHQDFKWQFIASADRFGDTIPYATVEAWIKQKADA